VTARARALGNDAALAERGGEDDDKGLTHMVMDGGVEANAVGGGDEVATMRSVEVSAASTGTVRAGRGSNELRRAEEEVKGEGSDIVVRN
jgi:hypothetical protein